LITGNDSGALEMYDIRQMKKALISKKCAHGKSILTIDWNPKFKNLLASGSLDKEIKIWEVNP
jgi:WD40 repeat protein